jgi:mannose-6-phosphate isomerase-like protein (cupin superfamily)
MQRLIKQSLSATLLAGVFLTALWSQNMGTKGSQLVWAPKPISLTPWAAPAKPHWKLSGILAAHKGQKTWTEPIVDDEFLHGEYIQAAPGDKTPRRAHPDTREWWVVWDGEIRFTIDGVEPFVAKKGFLVQVPYRTFYTMETLGDKPSLRFEVNIAKARTMYPVDVTPPALAGFKFEKTTVASKGVWDQGNKPYIDFNQIAAGKEKAGRFIADDRAVSNIIYGDPAKLAPVGPNEKGHFHAECAEFWFILLGKVSYRMEGVPEIMADEGDIVYAPRGRFHLPRFAGDKMSCRLAMNGFQDIAHFFEPKD